MRIHSVFTEAVDLIHPGEYHLKYDDDHRRYTPATDASPFDGKTGIAVLLAVCRRQNFNAFVPIITTKCFLRPSTLDLFIQSPTYHFATSLLLHFPDSDLMAEKPRSYAEDKFVEFSKPLRFLKNVRFTTTIFANFDVSPIIENHVLPLLFLENAEIFIEAPKLLRHEYLRWYENSLGTTDYLFEELSERNEVLPFFHLLKHKRERVRADAAHWIDVALINYEGQRSPFQNKLVELNALEILFGLLRNKVDDETSWCAYMNAAGSICYRNDNIDFDRQILPHLHLIKQFLNAESTSLMFSASYFLNLVVNQRADTIAPKLVEHGFVEPLVQTLRFDPHAEKIFVKSPYQRLYVTFWNSLQTLVWISRKSSSSGRKAIIETDFVAVAKTHLSIPSNLSKVPFKGWLCEVLNNLMPDLGDDVIDTDLLSGVLQIDKDECDLSPGTNKQIPLLLGHCLKKKKKLFPSDAAFYKFIVEEQDSLPRFIELLTMVKYFGGNVNNTNLMRDENEAATHVLGAIWNLLEHEFFVFQCTNIKSHLISIKKSGDKSFNDVNKGIKLFKSFAEDSRIDDAKPSLDTRNLHDIIRQVKQNAFGTTAKGFFEAHNPTSSSSNGQISKAIESAETARQIIEAINVETVLQEATEIKRRVIITRKAELEEENHADVDEVVFAVAKHFGKEDSIRVGGQLEKVPRCPLYKALHTSDTEVFIRLERYIQESLGRDSHDDEDAETFNRFMSKCNSFYRRYDSTLEEQLLSDTTSGDD